ncbi:DUF1573 domain-containing protein [Solitalea sp. MAHUQ-68]|uniref:DUF1573 domain-containing protein n=1 Tax=Solitalea agri TaxID=2953739 RepID=A0A9X2JBX8_9SPHI|nr:DUF1573 domain-containing protein [Solitalea agri]MCO4292463.1 DUF1573 domain-containing protein [Solitalea agri]
MPKFLRKTILLFCIALIGCSPKSGIEIREGSMQQAIKKAKRKNKTLIAITTQGENAIYDILAKNITDNFYKESNPSKYLFYKINAGNPENRWVSQWLYNNGYPSTYIISPKGKFITTIQHGYYKCFLEVLKQVDQSKTDSLYKYCSNQWNIEKKELPLFLDQVLQVKYAELKGQHKKEWMKDSLLNSIAKKPYFYNNYLLSKYYFAVGDTTQAKKYAQNALTFNEKLDTLLYTSLRPELKFIEDNSFLQSNEPVLALDRPKYSLRENKPGEEKEIIIYFMNKGKRTLVLKKVKCSVPSTRLTWDRKAIAPGAQAYIKARVKQTGVFEDQIQIFSNASSEPVAFSVKSYDDVKSYAEKP